MDQAAVARHSNTIPAHQALRQKQKPSISPNYRRNEGLRSRLPLSSAIAQQKGREMANVVVEHRNQLHTLSAKSIKATVVLTPAEVVNIPAPDGKPRCSVRIAVAGRIVTAELNAKSVRRAIANVREAGPDNVSCILQGRLDANNALLEAGITVQLKTKPEAPAPAKIRCGEKRCRQAAPVLRTAPLCHGPLLQVLSRLSQIPRPSSLQGDGPGKRVLGM